MPDYEKTPYGLKSKTKDGKASIKYFSYDDIVRLYESNKITKYRGVVIGEYNPKTSKFVKLGQLPEFYDLFNPKTATPKMDVEDLQKNRGATSEQANKETQTCPFCFEEVKIGAKKCRHCGETLDATLRVAEEAKRAADRQAVNVNTNVNTHTHTNVQPVSYLRDFPHVWHLLITLLCMGWWLPVWILHYVFRDRTYYR